MPTVEFYYMPESPPCRAVEMVAEMAGVTLNKHYVNLATGEHLKDEHRKLNPLHKIPFIIDGALKMNESRAIIAYLVNRYMPADNTLYPRDPIKRAQVDELLFLDLGTLFLSLVKMFRPLIWGHAKEINVEDEKAARETLTHFDTRLQTNNNKKFMTGDELTIADISFAATFTFCDACNYDISEFKSLSAYVNRLKTSIPKYKEINDGAIENFKNFIKSNQEGK